MGRTRYFVGHLIGLIAALAWLAVRYALQSWTGFFEFWQYVPLFSSIPFGLYSFYAMFAEIVWKGAPVSISKFFVSVSGWLFSVSSNMTEGNVFVGVLGFFVVLPIALGSAVLAAFVFWLSSIVCFPFSAIYGLFCGC